MNIYSHEQCTSKGTSQGKYNDHEIVDKVEFCAGHMEGQKDACQGDSGAPLICINDQNEPVIQGENFLQRTPCLSEILSFLAIGLVAWGVQCGLPQYPGVYTRVGAFLGWISETVTGMIFKGVYPVTFFQCLLE